MEALNAKRAAERVEHDLGFDLREMAANLLRTVRGAGKPYDLAKQMKECLAAFEQYQAVVGNYPPSDLVSRMLQPGLPWPKEPSATKDVPRHDLDVPGELVQGKREERDAMRRASLQITASMLVSQLTQQSKGESDLIDAINAHDQLQQELRAYRAAERAGAKKPPIKKKLPKSGKA